MENHYYRRQNLIDLSDEDGEESKERKRLRHSSPANNSSSREMRGTTHHQANAHHHHHQVLIILNTEPQEEVVVTDGSLIELLAEKDKSMPQIVTLCGQHHQGITTRQSTLHHIQQRDRWSCGFRNLQMILTALVPILPRQHPFVQQRRLFDAEPGAIDIPSLVQIKHMLQEAWSKGHDPKGAQFYGGEIVKKSGKDAHIGAVEVATILACSNGIDSTVVQFVLCKESRNLLGRFCLEYFHKSAGKRFCPYCSGGVDPMSSQSLAETVLHYAGLPSVTSIGSGHIGADAKCSCPVLPLYLQWKGHSVTLVGVECNDQGRVLNMLVFDPMKSGLLIENSLKRSDLTPLRVSIRELQRKDCQIVVVSTKPFTKDEQQRVKSSPDWNVLTAAPEAVRRARNRL